MPLRRPALTALAAALALSSVLPGLTAPTVATPVGPAGPRPDLVVAAASAPASVRSGDAVVVRTTVKNRGRAAAGRSTTSFALSTDRKVGRDRALRPTRAVPALRPGRTHRSSTRVRVPASVRPGRYWVVACADAGRKVRELDERTSSNCRLTGALRVTARPGGPTDPVEVPTSYELIEADVASGRITAEQALVYRVFSDYEDPRLPARYRGPAESLGHGAVADAAEQWDDLAPATQDAVRPFLVPPFYAGSHWSPAAPLAPAAPVAPAAPARRAFDAPWCSGGEGTEPLYETWDHVDATDGSVRIWWHADTPGDAVTAGHYLQLLEGQVLPALTALMGRGPKPDSDGLCDGGTGALDIALVDARTATTYADGACDADGTSTHMIFPRDPSKVGWPSGDPYLAHEVMHAIQFAFPSATGCDATSWVREMTAQWVQDYVTDPAYGIGLGPDDTEHDAADEYLQHPGTSLDVSAPPVHHDYGDYLFTQWVVRRTDPSFVRDVWTAMAGNSAKGAVDEALGGDGFEGVWDEFALSAWNRAPIEDFARWDGMLDGAKLSGKIPVPVGKPAEPAIPVEHLANQYAYVDLDEGVKELEVVNDQVDNDQATVRAVITYDDGTYDVRELDERITVLCIDDGTRRATDVVLIFSNADLDARVTFAPVLRGSNACGCPAATPAAPDAAAAAASTGGSGGTCGGANLTWSWTDDYTGDEFVGQERGSGSLTLGLVADPDHPGQYRSAPGSTYEVSETGHHVWYRDAPNGCGDATTDVTQVGSGVIPDGDGLAIRDPDRGTLDLYTLLLLDVTRTVHTEVKCFSTDDETKDWFTSMPECEPKVPGTSPSQRYPFRETSPGSGSWTFSCSGRATYVDANESTHVLTATVTGTLTVTG